VDDSESQFQELLAHVIARTNKMLSERGVAFPLGLLLKPSGEVDVSVAAYEKPEQVEELVGAMLGSMIERASASSAVAACMSVPDAGGASVVIFLENNENYCAKVTLPISDETAALDPGGMTVEDGAVHVFPLYS
jgi:hypothetical protein